MDELKLIEKEKDTEAASMLQIKNYVKVASLEEAYELNQKKNNVIIGGMHWLKMSKASVGTAIDLSGLGLDQIVETEEQFEKADSLIFFTLSGIVISVRISQS